LINTESHEIGLAKEAEFVEQALQSTAMEMPVTTALELLPAFLEAAGREVPVCNRS
jgi:hypothetical protein